MTSTPKEASFSHDKKFNHITFNFKGYSTALINSLRRTMLLDVPTLGFCEYLDEDDLSLLTSSKSKRHTVLVDTLASQAIPIMAHRCSRIPINTTDDTTQLLISDENKKVYFVICDNSEITRDTDIISYITTPHIESGLTKSIYSRDLKPIVLTKNSEGEFLYDPTQSDQISSSISEIFKFNVLVATVTYKEKLNVILKPTIGTGRSNARWTPCTFRYGFKMDPTWLEQRKGVVKAETNDITRKVEDDHPLRYLFTHHPTTNKAYNKFGLPYGHKLMFQYNGRKDPADSIKESIEIIKKALEKFKEHYLFNGDEDDAFFLKENNAITDANGITTNIQTILAPKDSQMKLRDDEKILFDHTIGNLLTTAMLEIVDTMGRPAGPDWTKVHIAYKIPHPLINQCAMLIKIPEALGNIKDLVDRAFESIRHDLDTIIRTMEP